MWFLAYRWRLCRHGLLKPEHYSSLFRSIFSAPWYVVECCLPVVDYICKYGPKPRDLKTYKALEIQSGTISS